MKILPLFAALLFLLLPGEVLALRSGDVVVDLKVDYLANGPFPVVPARIDQADAKKLKILVMLRAAEGGGEAVLYQLYDLARQYPACRFGVVSSDPEPIARELFGAFPKPNFTTAIDKKLESTRKFMGASGIFPKAFVIDYQGKIIWDGQAVDLPEMLERFHRGEFDAAGQQKLSILLENLQSRLRNNEEAEADRTVREILRTDPANMAALRLRLFMLESSGRAADGWKLLEQQVKHAPKAERLYLMQIDYAARNPGIAGDLGGLVVRYMKNAPAYPLNDCTLAWNLLNSYPLDPMLLQISGILVERAGKLLPDTEEDTVRAEVLSATALYYSRTGRLDAAASAQQNATRILRKTAPHRAPASESLEKFYAIARQQAAR